MAMKDAGKAGQLGFHHGITDHDFEKPNDVLDHIVASYEENKALNAADRAYSKSYAEGEKARDK
jgi:hypothetical protein